MKIKTSELTGLQLDWAVAKCEGLDVYIPAFADTPWLQFKDCYGTPQHCPKFSTDWAQGGPIIELEGIDVSYVSKSDWFASKRENHEKLYFGLSPLVAAMRCFVTSKLGDEVEVPEELR